MRPPAHSLVELNLLRDKRQTLRLGLGWNRRVRREDREGHDRRVRFNSRACLLEIGNALFELHANRAALATAIVVGFMDDVRGGKNLDPQEQTNRHGYKKPPRIPAHAPKAAKAKHL